MGVVPVVLGVQVLVVHVVQVAVQAVSVASKVQKMMMITTLLRCSVVGVITMLSLTVEDDLLPSLTVEVDLSSIVDLPSLINLPSLIAEEDLQQLASVAGDSNHTTFYAYNCLSI